MRFWYCTTFRIPIPKALCQFWGEPKATVGSDYTSSVATLKRVSFTLKLLTIRRGNPSISLFFQIIIFFLIFLEEFGHGLCVFWEIIIWVCLILVFDCVVKHKELNLGYFFWSFVAEEMHYEFYKVRAQV